MLKKIATVVLSLAALQISSASAVNLEWSGLYRIEGYDLSNTELRNSSKKNQQYGLHHLILRPKVIASDGITIHSQFEIFNPNTRANNGFYNNSQMGDFWGSGVNATDMTNTPSQSNALSANPSAGTVNVSQLYMTYDHEFGQFIVGRVPIQFGLGMTYSAGRGLFDHWYNTKDLVGYKMIFGNMSLLPMIGKSREGLMNYTDDVDNYMIQFIYENPETDISMGVFYDIKKSSDQGSDAPTGVNGFGGAGSRNSVGMNIKTLTVFALRDTRPWRLGFEASFVSGDYGVQTVDGQNVGAGGYGIAVEVDYKPEASKSSWGLRTGIATGDDPNTNNYESFLFNKNYDVAFLMFNHMLGQFDVLRTSPFTPNYFRSKCPAGTDYENCGPSTAGATPENRGLDIEAISNVIYLAPRYHYQWTDRWSLGATLVTGWVRQTAQANMKSDLGYEADFSLAYSPKKGILWVNQVGLLFPGAAFKAGGLYESTFTMGFGTKAAISF